MKEEKPKVIIAGSSLDYIGFKTAQLFAQTTEDMQVYRNFETDEVTSNPPLNKVFTIHEVDHNHEYLSGREKRRQKRKQQRKNK